MRRYHIYYRNLDRVLGGVTVRDITYGVLEDAKLQLAGTQKTKHDTFCFMKGFMSWCVDREYISGIPKFPKLSRQMGMRKIMSKKDQTRVVQEIHDIYMDSEPRVCIGIELLATYPKIRPGELLQVQEKHIDSMGGWLKIPNPKESHDPKIIKLIDRHLVMLRVYLKGEPERYLLSFENGHQFGRDYLYLAWQKACSNLGIEGVSLYPGTKHTTATYLAKKYPYKLVKEAAGVNSAAMERYINFQETDVLPLYEEASPL